MTTTSTSDLAQAITDIRADLMHARSALDAAHEALDCAIGHTAYAQETTTDQAADGDSNTQVTTRTIPADQLRIGMRIAIDGGPHKIVGAQYSRHSIRVFAEIGSSGITAEYAFGPDDEVTIADVTGETA